MVASSSSYDSNVKLSPMVEGMAVSKTIEIHSLTKELEQGGQKIYSLCVGEPDFQPPDEVIQATVQAARDGDTKYTGVSGNANLRRAIAADLWSRKHVKYSPDEVVVSNGAKQAVLQAMMAVVSPGDRVIIPAPYWTSYPDMVKMCLATPLIVGTEASSDYTLSSSALRAALSSSSSGPVSCLILCNPSNPTGCVSGQAALEDIAAVLRDFPSVVVLSDEIYERLTYEDTPHVSFASLPGMFERTITINGFSKSHSMTGYRIGYSCAPLRISKAISKLQSQITSCASSISQHAAHFALTTMPLTNPSWMAERVEELQVKRDLAYTLLHSIPGVTCPKPMGAFYLLPDVSCYYGKKLPPLSHGTSSSSSSSIVVEEDEEAVIVSDSHVLCMQLLRREGVALVPGEAFGAPSTVRISYAASSEVITEAIHRLHKFLVSLQ